MESMKKPSLHIKEMRNLANLLAEYSYPKRMTQEEDIACLKQRQITYDGYEVILYFGKSDYGGLIIYMLSITGKYFPFLPFNLVCKVARQFLGEKSLSLIEYAKDKHKVYTWMLMTNIDDVPISNAFLTKSKPYTYNGLEFVRMNNKKAVLIPP
jgi:hypothetical protein